MVHTHTNTHIHTHIGKQGATQTNKHTQLHAVKFVFNYTYDIWFRCLPFMFACLDTPLPVRLWCVCLLEGIMGRIRNILCISFKPIHPLTCFLTGSAPLGICLFLLFLDFRLFFGPLEIWKIQIQCSVLSVESVWLWRQPVDERCFLILFSHFFFF